MAWTSPQNTLQALSRPKAPILVKTVKKPSTPIEKAKQALIKARSKASKDFYCPCGCYKSENWFPETIEEYEEDLKKYRVLWCRKCLDYQPAHWIVDKSKTQPGFIPPQNAYQLFCDQCSQDFGLSLDDLK